MKHAEPRRSDDDEEPYLPMKIGSLIEARLVVNNSATNLSYLPMKIGSLIEASLLDLARTRAHDAICR